MYTFSLVMLFVSGVGFGGMIMSVLLWNLEKEHN